MSTPRLLDIYIKNYKARPKALYILGCMLLFWALFDGIISFMTPIIITNKGISETLMGIIIGTSSITGALFDFIICRLFKDTYYKRIFLVMFVICLVYPLILYKANIFIVYILAMALWGVYYDLKNVGNFDFIGRHTPKDKHAENFGLIQVFQAIGYLVAPIFVGFIIAEEFNYKPLVLAWVFLVMGFIFFLFLFFLPSKKALPAEKIAAEPAKRSIWSEINIWSRLGRILLPALILTLMLNFIDAFFWTIGPIFAESLMDIQKFSGFLMVAYSLPPLLVGWGIGFFVSRYGKKRTAFSSLAIGSLFLILIYFIASPILIITDIFLASFFISMSWPAINGAYADYISETTKYEKEIEGLEDFYTNLGYVIGPMMAGFVASTFGNAGAFSFIGAIGIIVAIVLIIVSPKKINVYSQLAKQKEGAKLG